MTAPTGIRSGVGFRNCVIFSLNANGLPDATGATAYEGVRLSGAKTFTVIDPEPRRIPHIGDDSIISIDVLPPIEVMACELRAGKLNDVVDAILTGQKKFSVGEMALFGVGTDKRGFEPQVGLMAYRQAQDTDPDSASFGQRVWEVRFIPKAVLYSRETGYTDQPEDHVYTVIPAKAGSHLWGEQFSEATEGFAQAQMVRGVCWHKPKLVAWKGDGTATEFIFPVDAQAVSTNVISVWKNGTEQTTGITKAITGITFTAPPADGNIIVALYEVA